MALKIELDSSIHIEDILNKISAFSENIEWDYSDDLKMQYIIIKSSLDEVDFKELINDLIENIDEILPADFVVKKGLRGFVQLIILKLLSEKMKDSYDKRYFD